MCKTKRIKMLKRLFRALIKFGNTVGSAINKLLDFIEKIKNLFLAIVKQILVFIGFIIDLSGFVSIAIGVILIIISLVNYFLGNSSDAWFFGILFIFVGYFFIRVKLWIIELFTFDENIDYREREKYYIDKKCSICGGSGVKVYLRENETAQDQYDPRPCVGYREKCYTCCGTGYVKSRLH